MLRGNVKVLGLNAFSRYLLHLTTGKPANKERHEVSSKITKMNIAAATMSQH